MKLENNKWQQVSDKSGAKIYSHIVKPDILSSNSFLIQGEDQMIVIDPGGLDTQWHFLTDLIKSVLKHKSMPILIGLTHCHVDHCRAISMNGAFTDLQNVRVAIQKDGASVLSQANARMSLAELYGYTISPMQPDLLLFTHKMEKGSLDCPVENLEKKTGRLFLKQCMNPGGKDCFEAYHTPGHSPDSVCFRYNDLLFISDLLSAVSPMVAGIPGWNKDLYTDTLLNILWLLESSDIEWCLPGHGVPMPADEVKPKLSQLLDKAKRLGPLNTFDKDKLLFTKAYAIDQLKEISDVFTILSGRLYALAYHLKELEESKEARKYQKLLDADQIEFHILEFYKVLKNVTEGKQLDLHLVHTAAAVTRKIMKLFNQSKYDAVIDKSYIRRASGLLTDFLTIIRGVDHVTEDEDISMNDLMATLTGEIKNCLYKDESIFDTIDNDTRFLQALAARIAYVPIFKGVRIDFSPGKNIDGVRLDIQRFKDAFMGLMEHIALAKVKHIVVSTYVNEKETGIKIITDRSNGQIILDQKFKMHLRRFKICGVHFHRLHTQKEKGFSLIFPKTDRTGGIFTPDLR